MFIEPLKDFFSKKNALWICLFILAYKLGDGLASSLTTPFFLQIGFTKTDIATFAKTLGLFSSIAGAFLAGGLMKHLSIYSALFIFGVFQMASTLVYAVLATVHHQTWMLGLGMFIEYFAAGMGSCALATYMGQKSARVYAASQFALLSSLMGIPRVIFAAPMGWVAQQTGWVWFFILCTLLGLPGLFLLKKLKI